MMKVKLSLMALALLALCGSANAAKLVMPSAIGCSDLVNGNPVNLIMDKKGHVEMILFRPGQESQTSMFSKTLKEKDGVYGVVETLGNAKLMLKITPSNENEEGAHVELLMTQNGVTVGDHSTDNCRIQTPNNNDQMKDFE